MFLSDKLPPSYLRTQDRLLDYIRKFLVGCRIGKMTIDESRFLLFLKFKNEHEENLFAFGYKERHLYFFNKNKDEIYASWTGEIHFDKSYSELLADFDGERIKQNDEKSSSWNLEKYFQEEDRKKTGQKAQTKKEKFLEKKIKNISDDLAQAFVWRLIEKDLLSDELQFFENENFFHGHKIKWKNGLSVWQKRDAVFAKIKKLKKAEKILELRKKETQEELKKVRSGDFKVEVTKEKAIAPLWQNGRLRKREKGQGEGNLRIKNFKIKNWEGIISLDAKSNDWLRKQGGKKNYWFHIDGYPGAHCVVKTENVEHFSADDLGALASMLRDYSHLEIFTIPLVYSQLKGVRGLKGSSGKVLVTKPKYFHSNYLSWKERITIL